VIPLPDLREGAAKTARLEQRTSPEVKKLIERAARLQGVNASEFIVANAAQAARETIARLETTRLAAEDIGAFRRALDAPPSRALVDLMRVHGKIAARK